MNPLLYPIVIPLALGVLCVLTPRGLRFIREFLAVGGTLATLGVSIWLFIEKPLEWTFQGSLLFRLDDLSAFILLAAAMFGFLIALYSIRYMAGSEKKSSYYGSLLWTLAAACGALLANHLVLLIVFWGFLGMTLYLMILTGGKASDAAAKKTLVIVGGTDALMILGVALIYSLSQTFDMNRISLPLNTVTAYFAYFMLALGAFAKAGAMPLHTWIPDMADTAPVPATAFVPAALDKLLGIYLLARMSLKLFQMNHAMQLFLLIIGAVTIIAAVMMALIQHDMRRLLAYHAVSQVGYMVLGIGTGNPIGIAGGIFHMLNHSIYKACLFLTSGAVQHRTGSTDLDRLGGLGRIMPFTFASFLIAAFAISGIPPLNGFVSKWMIYQGLIELAQVGDRLWVIWLIAAMFGSGLTLASFMKLTHAVFLGVPSRQIQTGKIREAGAGMVIPMVVLALLCLVFGILAFQVPLRMFLLPVVPGVSYLGIWSPGLAMLMILLGLMLGLFIYLLGNWKGIREADAFIGGEKLPVEERVTGTGFYNTIREMGVIHSFYKWAEAKFFDVYELGSRLFFSIAGGFQKVHTGVLNTYVLWIFLGLVVLFITMMGR